MTRFNEAVGISILVDTDLVFPNPRQPRKYFNEKSLQLLARSIKVDGQENAAKVRELGKLADGRTTFQLIDGERRWRACAMIGRKLWAVVRPARSDAEHFRSSVISNLAGDLLTPLETAHALAQIQRDFPGMTQADLGSMCCKSHGWASQYLSLLKLPQAVQEMMAPGLPKEKRMPFFVATSLVPLPEKEQLDFLRAYKKHRWKTAHALQEIRRRARKLGTNPETGKRQRQPSDDYKILCSFYRRMQSDAKMLLGLSPELFDAMFAPRSEKERLEMLKAMRDTQELLGLLNTRVNHAIRLSNHSKLRLA